MKPKASHPISRRTALKSLAVSGAAGVFCSSVKAQSLVEDTKETVLGYLESLARPDGGYAWHGQQVSHLTPTMFVVGCYHLLGEQAPRKEDLIRFTWENHPQQVWGLSERRFILDYQHIQALAWLGEDLSALKASVASLKEPRVYNKRYELNGHPYFQAEVKHFLSRKLLRLPPPAQPFVDYLDARRRANGSFNTTLAQEGGDGNILNTWWGLEALEILGRVKENQSSTIQWLQACQLPSGGFTHQPDPELGGLDDVAYTWAGLKALQMLGSSPEDSETCIEYLNALANEDGGFADRPGWLSNPMATFYALESLSILDGLKLSGIRKRTKVLPKKLPSGLNVYSMQIESHGRGSPAETVALAKALKIQLWGAKNADSGWRKKVEELAREQGVPVTFFLADEEYGSWIDIPGYGTYSHIADIMAPTTSGIGESLSGKGPVSWQTFREQRLRPLQDGQGRLNWQFGQHEEVIRVLLDDSLMRAGYSTISSFHFGNIDFTTSEPFLHRWRGQLPFIALQDAHGEEPWWFCDQTEGMRTLFLGTDPSWGSWLKALDNNWVAAVRHDYRTNYQTWMHCGSDEVAGFIQQRELDWRWWDNPSCGRPMVSLVAVKPDDGFEAARPEQGVNLRVRAAHRNTNHGLLKEPLALFEDLKVNGQVVVCEKTSVASKRSPELLEDEYHSYLMPKGSGRFTATATVRVIVTGALIRQTIDGIV